MCQKPPAQSSSGPRSSVEVKPAVGTKVTALHGDDKRVLIGSGTTKAPKENDGGFEIKNPLTDVEMVTLSKSSQ